MTKSIKTKLTIIIISILVLTTVSFSQGNYDNYNDLSKAIDSNDIDKLNSYHKILKYELELRLKNLRNINCDGYKRIMFYPSQVPFEKLTGNMPINEFRGIAAKGAYTDFSQGSLKRTDKLLDLAIAGKAFLF